MFYLQDRERQDQLTELLARYSASGLPPLPELLTIGRQKFDEQNLEMEGNWRDFVSGHEVRTRLVYRDGIFGFLIGSDGSQMGQT